MEDDRIMKSKWLRISVWLNFLSFFFLLKILRNPWREQVWIEKKRIRVNRNSCAWLSAWAATTASRHRECAEEGFARHQQPSLRTLLTWSRRLLCTTSAPSPTEAPCGWLLPTDAERRSAVDRRRRPARPEGLDPPRTRVDRFARQRRAVEPWKVKKPHHQPKISRYVQFTGYWSLKLKLFL